MPKVWEDCLHGRGGRGRWEQVAQELLQVQGLQQDAGQVGSGLVSRSVIDPSRVVRTQWSQVRIPPVVEQNIVFFFTPRPFGRPTIG